MLASPLTTQLPKLKMSASTVAMFLMTSHLPVTLSKHLPLGRLLTSFTMSPSAMLPVCFDNMDLLDCAIDFSSFLGGESEHTTDPFFYTPPPCANVKPIPVFNSCLVGSCDCIFMIGLCATQLKPCRAAQFLFGPSALDSIPVSECDFLWKGLNCGFDILDDGCPAPYSCANYNSIMEECTHTEMSDLLKKEIAEGKVPRMSDPPHCIHSLGAVRKANGSLRPITDCSQAEGSSINNYMSSTFKSFTYNYVQTTVDMLAPSDFMAVVDSSSAYRPCLMLR